MTAPSIYRYVHLLPAFILTILGTTLIATTCYTLLGHSRHWARARAAAAALLARAHTRRTATWCSAQFRNSLRRAPAPRAQKSRLQTEYAKVPFVSDTFGAPLRAVSHSAVEEEPSSPPSAVSWHLQPCAAGTARQRGSDACCAA